MMCNGPVTARPSTLLHLHATEQLHLLDVAHALRIQTLQDCTLVELIQAQVILQCNDILRSVIESDEDTEVGGVFGPAFTTGHVPSIAHHELKIIVVVNGSTDPLVSINKLGLINGAILIGIIISNEEVECIRLRQLALHHVRVFGHIILGPDIFFCHKSVAIRIKNGERFQHKILSELVHVPANRTNVFIVVDEAGVIPVEEREERLLLIRGKLDLPMIEELLEHDVHLFPVKLTGVVPVNDAKLPAHAFH
mmetsp:Transcript_87372/g.154650  ORF Transcript_87372/g.154650 Transcript_87372/m.154650 type:complete len:252 (-) Transcript_87372:961-1716(-)